MHPDVLGTADPLMIMVPGSAGLTIRGVLRINAIGAGAVEYLLRGSGCDHTRERADGEPEHEHDAPGYFAAAIEHGEPSGVWHGRGMAGVGLDARAGDTARDDDVRAIFGQLRHPDSTEAEPQWIGSRPRRYRDGAERLDELLAKEPDASEERLREIKREAASSGRRPVAYYDVTMSPPKSVSVLYAALLAAGDLETADAVRAAHDEAVKIAIDYGEQHVAWTRRGRHGRDGDGRRVGEFVPATGLSVITFGHSTSREAEPQLHTHAAVLNRVGTEDGHVGALDGKAFGPIKEAMGAAYARALEQLINEATGAVFATRPDGMAREVVGVDPELCDDASTRRAQVVERVEDLVAAYRERHGREPDAAARKAMAQAATLDTRRPKSGLAGPAAVAAWAESRAEWCAAILDQVDDAAIAARAAATADMTGRGRGAGDRSDDDRRAERVAAAKAAGVAAAKAAGVADVQGKYSTWTLGNLVEAIDRHLGDAAELGVPARERAGVVEGLAREALASDAGLDVVRITGHEPVAVPDALRRTGPGQDGRPRFRPVNDERYATGAHLTLEDHVVALARTQRGPVIADPEVGERLDAAGLSPDQRSAVLGILGTDRGGAVLIGPAGTGKSRTVGALAHEWTASTGGQVYGVATSQIATANLAGDGLHAINVWQFLRRFEGGEPGDRLTDRDLLVVDEAGMSSSADLEGLARIAARAGARIVFTGDPEQLDAVEAGGLFAYLAAVLDPAQRHDLAEVHRFAAEWERDASLLLRDGDPAAVDEYADRGRLHTGTLEEMGAAASRAFLADTVAGRSSLLIVGTNAHADQLSAQVRDELVRLGVVDAGAALATVQGGNLASVGDRVQARLNRYDLRVEPGVDEHGLRGEARPVTNREVYTVLGVDEHGAVLARDERGAVAHIPVEYLREHAALAYATTVHGAQGVNVDAAHAVLDRDASREHAYVAATRGRDENHFWLVTEREPDEHDPERVSEQAAERLADVLARSGSQTSATATREEADADLASLAAVVARFDVVTGWASRDRHDELLTQALGEQDAQRLQQDPGRGRLLRSLREAEFAGHDPEAVVRDAAEASLTGSDSVADVLRARVRAVTAHRDPDREVKPTEWASRTLAGHGDGEVAGYVRDVAELASQRQTVLGQRAAEHAPEWAVDALGEPPERHEGEGPVTEPRGRWEDRAGVAAAYRELASLPDDQVSLGAAPSRERDLDRALWRDAVDALGQRTEDGAHDQRAAPAAELYAARERWAREQDAAPRWVADELAERHDLARQYREDAALERARLEAMEPGDPEASPLEERLQRSSWFAERHQEAAADLEVEHQARQSWWRDQAPQRVADEAAADELARRNLPAERVLDPRERDAPDAQKLAPQPHEPDVVPPESERTDEREHEQEERQADAEQQRHQETADRLAESVRQAQDKVAAARARLEAQREEDEARARYDPADHQHEMQTEIAEPEAEYGDNR